MSSNFGSGDLQEGLEEHSPLTALWAINEVVSTDPAVLKVGRAEVGIAPDTAPIFVGSSAAAEFDNAWVRFVSGELAGIPPGGGTIQYGQFNTTIASITTANSPASCTITLSDPIPTGATVNVGDLLVVDRNLRIGSTLNISGDVTATVSGPVDATITGSTVTLDSNTTVLNEQLGTGLNFSLKTSVDVPQGNPTGTTSTGTPVNLVPAGQSIVSSALQAWVVSSFPAQYAQVALTLNMVQADGTVAFVTNATITPINSPVTGVPAFVNLSDVLSISADTGGVPLQFNQIVLNATCNNTTSADTVTVYAVFAGQAVPDITSPNNPSIVSPSFQLPGSTGQTSMYNGVPLPTQRALWNGSTSTYVGSPANPRKAGQYNAEIAATTTVSTSAQLGTVTTIYRMTLVVLGASEGVQIKAHTSGSVIGMASNGNPLQVDWGDSGLAVGDTIDLDNYTNNPGNVSFSVEYV